MAAPMLRAGLGVLAQICKMPEGILGLTSVRCASKKAGGSSRNKRKRTRNQHRGIKLHHGEMVHRGNILVRQLGLNLYPGENVGVGKDCTLFALEDGKVVVTSETLSPYPNSPLYPYVKNGGVIEKEFFHVIPEEQKGIFKLVSQI